MNNISLPEISQSELENLLSEARNSPRHRYPKILHEKGDVLNRVINFMLDNTYMEPHLHPGIEKIEDIYLLEGKLSVIEFDEVGKIEKTTILDKGDKRHIQIPAFTWHTYVVLSDYAVTYETMMGQYDPKTWKNFSDWAPKEGLQESEDYLLYLKRKCQQD